MPKCQRKHMRSYSSKPLIFVFSYFFPYSISSILTGLLNCYHLLSKNTCIIGSFILHSSRNVLFLYKLPQMCTHLYPKICVVMAELKPAANSNFKEYWCGQNPVSCKFCMFIGTVSLNSTELIFFHIVSGDTLFQSCMLN